MKKMTFLCVVILIASFTLAAVAGCAAPTPEPAQAPAPVTVPAPAPTPPPTPPPPAPTPTPAKKITLEDAPQILNLIPLLPAGFEKVDAASEGMSKADMGIYDPDASEIELFLSADPFQMIYGMLAIYNSKIDQASFDAAIKDVKQMESLLIENLKSGAQQEGFELEVPQIQITYPNIGDAAVLAEGQMEAGGFFMGFDTLWFRKGSVFVFIYSSYMSLERQTLTPIAEQIEGRISQFSQ